MEKEEAQAILNTPITSKEDLEQKRNALRVLSSIPFTLLLQQGESKPSFLQRIKAFFGMGSN